MQSNSNWMKAALLYRQAKEQRAKLKAKKANKSGKKSSLPKIIKEIRVFLSGHEGKEARFLLGASDESVCLNGDNGDLGWSCYFDKTGFRFEACENMGGSSRPIGINELLKEYLPDGVGPSKFLPWLRKRLDKIADRAFTEAVDRASASTREILQANVEEIRKKGPRMRRSARSLVHNFKR